ncbi:UDP-3-O-acyl-N-acetylglucosamine deacetylase [Aminobacterium sp. UBA5514]|uniref:UDP-3-O-acyl-N-acetylglucosamine deacetylase n=1 Tax=Aminobacterium sp. UBA5514 TaxID=1946036 RepID=UPI00257B029F|nr:UDP-3-O-acyl-N-acetylglucosamine deacetylase [Aminobacterium sp. UBA5514]
MTPLYTLASPIIFRGVGLHSGAPCSVELKPSTEDRGILFKINGEYFPLNSAEFSGDGRGTELLFPGGRRVRTVEHLLAALGAMEIGQVVVAVIGPEIPILDGGSFSFAKGIQEAGRTTTGVLSEPLKLLVPLVEKDETGNRILMAFPEDCLSITYIIEYSNPVIGTEIFDFRVTPEGFLTQIAPTRTFALDEEMDDLIGRGLAKGGTLSNAILVTGKKAETEGGLRFPNEFVRHKVLDIIGDLTLLGRPLHAHIVAIRTGHEMHLRLVRRLRALESRC